MNQDNERKPQTPVTPPPASTPIPNTTFSPTPPDPVPQKKRKNIPAIVLSVVVVLLLGVIGWLVYDKLTAKPAEDHSQHQTTETTKSEESTDQDEEDKTADWVALSNQAGKYSLKYPNNWTAEPAGDPSMCSPELTLLATSKDKIAKCATDGFGQMAFDSAVGDKTAEYRLSYPSKSAIVDGVKGVRYEGTVETTSESGIGPEVGTKEVLYVVYDGTRTYRAMYYQYPGDEDITSEFDLLVTQTLKFTN